MMQALGKDVDDIIIKYKKNMEKCIGKCSFCNEIDLLYIECDFKEDVNMCFYCFNGLNEIPEYKGGIEYYMIKHGYVYDDYEEMWFVDEEEEEENEYDRCDKCWQNIYEIIGYCDFGCCNKTCCEECGGINNDNGDFFCSEECVISRM